MISNIDLIIPTIPRDIHHLLNNLELYFKYLPISKICIVGTEELRKAIPVRDDLSFINEEDLIDYNRIKSQIVGITGHVNDGRRSGWYAQQFIKMGYARICKDDYYLLWDSDTIPLKNVSFFEKEHPIFDLKTEYHKPYFDTINMLFPGMKKIRSESFIAEHMLINTKIMCSMLDDIELNYQIQGDSFQEKIINAVAVEKLSGSGFSEFETYGTYVTKKCPDFYNVRNWRSMRFGGFFFNSGSDLNEKTISWLSTKYDAISFEKGDYISFVSKLVPFLSKYFSPAILDVLSVPIRACRKMRGRR